MPAHVRERLLDDPEDVTRHLIRKPRKRLGPQRGRDPGVLCRLLHQAIDGGLESELVQDAGPQLARDPTHDLHGLVHPVSDRALAQAERTGVVARQSMLDPRQVELQRREHLSQLVVNLSRDSRPFFFSRGLDSSSERSQLDAGPLQLRCRQRAVGDVALNPEMAGDSTGGIVEAHVIAFDPHRRSVETTLVGDGVRVTGVE